MLASTRHDRGRRLLQRGGGNASTSKGGSINVRSIRFALCVFGLAGAGWAQAIATSQVSGSVQDGSGAAVAGAQVRMVQTDTGQVRSTATGDDGSYLFPGLAIGPYRLEISKPG